MYPFLSSPSKDRFPAHLPPHFTAPSAAIPFLGLRGSVLPSHPNPRALVTSRCPSCCSMP